LDAFGERSKIIDALNLIIGQFDFEVILQAREHFERLQTVNAQLFVEIVLGRQRTRRDLELLRRQFEDFLGGLLDGAHTPSIYHPRLGKENTWRPGRRRYLEENQAMTHAKRNGFGTGGSTEFAEDGRDVEFGGVFRDLQFHADFLVT